MDGFTIQGNDVNEVIRSVERKEAIGYVQQGYMTKGLFTKYKVRVIRPKDSNRLEDYF